MDSDSSKREPVVIAHFFPKYDTFILIAAGSDLDNMSWHRCGLLSVSVEVVRAHASASRDYLAPTTRWRIITTVSR